MPRSTVAHVPGEQVLPVLTHERSPDLAGMIRSRNRPPQGAGSGSTSSLNGSAGREFFLSACVAFVMGPFLPSGSRFHPPRAPLSHSRGAGGFTKKDDRRAPVVPRRITESRQNRRPLPIGEGPLPAPVLRSGYLLQALRAVASVTPPAVVPCAIARHSAPQFTALLAILLPDR